MEDKMSTSVSLPRSLDDKHSSFSSVSSHSVSITNSTPSNSQKIEMSTFSHSVSTVNHKHSDVSQQKLNQTKQKSDLKPQFYLYVITALITPITEIILPFLNSKTEHTRIKWEITDLKTKKSDRNVSFTFHLQSIGERRKQMEIQIPKHNFIPGERVEEKSKKKPETNKKSLSYWYSLITTTGAQSVLLSERLLSIDEKVSMSVKDIDRDMDRTYTNHPFFREGTGRDSLRRVLVAFSIRKPDIGYCQSMNFIAALLLLFYPEENAFWMLVTVIEKVLPPDYYSSSMVGAQIDCAVFKNLLKKRNSKVLKHIAKFNLDPSIVVIPWLVCLFCHSSLPIESVLRVWDALFVEGNKILFRVGLAIFQLHSKEILKCNDTGELIGYISNMSAEMFDIDLLMKTAFYDIGTLSKSTLEKERIKCKKEVEQTLSANERARSQSS